MGQSGMNGPPDLDIGHSQVSPGLLIEQEHLV